MNPDLNSLQPYPFEKLNALKAGVIPPAHLEHIALSIGEPKHATPPFVVEALINSLSHLSTYPSTKGLPELRRAISEWCCKRFHLKGLDIDNEILPVNGTREALFAFTQTVIDRGASTKHQKPLVMMPNPFYQIYEGAAYLAGAEPHFLNAIEKNTFLPDIDNVAEHIWQRCQLLFVCSPGNPTGSVYDAAYFKKLIALSDRHNFVIASDECYSELYFDESQPPMGLLQACAELGRHDYKNCVVFHSLSKRSNLPGMRSGFVAGDARIMEKFLLYRTYHGCAMPLQHQYASLAAWQDEVHVQQNRQLYREKFMSVVSILKPVLNVDIPAASFYLWPEIPLSKTIRNECDFARELFSHENITVLPGTYLARDNAGVNPGTHRVRMALVASQDECIEAAQRIKRFVLSV